MNVAIRERKVKDDPRFWTRETEYPEEPFTELERTEVDRSLREKSEELCFRYVKFETSTRHPTEFVKYIFNV